MGMHRYHILLSVYLSLLLFCLLFMLFSFSFSFFLFLIPPNIHIFTNFRNSHVGVERGVASSSWADAVFASRALLRSQILVELHREAIP